MDEKSYRLNTTYAIVDTLVCLATIVCFGLSAYLYGKWWICLFNLFPLIIYSRHTIVIDNDISEQEENHDEH